MARHLPAAATFGAPRGSTRLPAARAVAHIRVRDPFRALSPNAAAAGRAIRGFNSPNSHHNSRNNSNHSTHPKPSLLMAPPKWVFAVAVAVDVTPPPSKRARA